jgi:hypothetical protein
MEPSLSDAFALRRMVAPAMKLALLKGLVSVTVGGITGGAVETISDAVSIVGVEVNTSIFAAGNIVKARSKKVRRTRTGVLFIVILLQF